MIHLVNMPMASLTHPTLALGVFQAQLRQAGLASRVQNLNFDFARRIGLGAYETIALFRGVETQVGEWLFAREAWREQFGPSEERFLELCGGELGTIPHVRSVPDWLRLIRHEVVPQFLRDSLERLAFDGPPRVVAFSCMFFQTVPALALGRLLKETYPDVRLVYGGACFHGEMGDELMRKVDWIDAVSTGEADDIIVPLLRELAEGGEPQGLQGVMYRDRAGQVHCGPPHRPVSAAVLDQLPVPDFDDFFAEAHRYGLRGNPAWQRRLSIPFESSRGCWWGQKQHCTFCGLNADGMAYRAKSAATVERDLRALAHRYPAPMLQAAENILAMPYFRDLLPRLKEEPLPGQPELFYPVKANLNRAQVKLMAEAGIRHVQPGIESLSSHLLQLMRKGVSALQNVFFLRCCQQYGVSAHWNNLIRIPGECEDDYRQMERWIPHLVHLRPPFGGAPKLEVHRFSPIYFERGRWVENLRAMAWYAGLFPAERIDLDRIAYYFDAEWKDVLPEPVHDGVRRATAEWIHRWREQQEVPVLEWMPSASGGLTIRDTRSGMAHVWTLNPAEAELYHRLDEPTARTGLGETETLEGWLQNGLILEEGGRYLALALPATLMTQEREVRKRSFRQIANQEPVGA